MQQQLRPAGLTLYEPFHFLLIISSVHIGIIAQPCTKSQYNYLLTVLLLMEYITLKEDPNLKDNQARVSVNGHTWVCDQASGEDFDSEKIIEKFMHNSGQCRHWVDAFINIDSLNILDCIR